MAIFVAFWNWITDISKAEEEKDDAPPEELKTGKVYNYKLERIRALPVKYGKCEGKISIALCPRVVKSEAALMLEEVEADSLVKELQCALARLQQMKIEKREQEQNAQVQPKL